VRTHTKNRKPQLAVFRTLTECPYVPRISLIEDLTRVPIPPGTQLLVEYDAPSLWYNASITISAVWLKTGGKVSYSVLGRSPNELRSLLKRNGLDPKNLEGEQTLTDKLQIWDFYTSTLGRKSKEKWSFESPRIADLSLHFIKHELPTEIRDSNLPPSARLTLCDNYSTLLRFNDEKSVLEYLLTRDIPAGRMNGSTSMTAFTTGVHSDWFYKQLEAAFDGIVDLKFDDNSDPPKNLMRIRSMQNVQHDARWHELRVGDNFEITLQK